MKDILKTILAEWLEKKLPQTIKREIDLEQYDNLKIKKAVVITGFRRVGKTYLMFDYIKKLLGKYSKKDVVYINFEDERIEQSTEVLSLLLPTIISFYNQKPKYLFLDEIQNIPLWSKWVRRILDTEEIKIFLSGSSSKIGSEEIPTELRGRFFEVKVYPLTLKEYFNFKNFNFDKEKIYYLVEEKAKFDYLLNEYLVWGGFPEVVLLPLEKKQEILQGYFNTVVKREIVDRFKIKNEIVLKTLLKLIINSTYISVSKLFNQLKSLGFSVGKTTVNQYLSYIESSYFLKQLFFYSPSMVNQLQYPRKIYLIDNGFFTSLSIKFSKNWGKLWENFVFWHLYRKYGEEIYFYQDRNKNEVDFVVFEGEKIKGLYQSCYQLTDFETKEREFKSLTKAIKKLSPKNAFLIVKDYEDAVVKDIKKSIIDIFDLI